MFTFKNGFRLDYSFIYSDDITLEGVPVDVRKVGEVVESREAIVLENLMKNVEGEPSVNCDCSVLEVIRKMQKRAPFFGPHVAMPSRKRIWTKRGEIAADDFVLGKNIEMKVGNVVVRKNEGVIEVTAGDRVIKKSNKLRNTLKWVLYMVDDYPLRGLRQGNGWKLIVGNGILVKQNDARVIRIGRHYYWGSTSDVYIGSGGFSVGGEGINYRNGELMISFDTLVPKPFIEKVEKGEKITIVDVIPGLSEDAVVEKSVINVNGKKFRYVIERVEENGFWTVVPYEEGEYRVFVPVDEPVDVWSPKSVEEVKKLVPVEPAGG